MNGEVSLLIQTQIIFISHDELYQIEKQNFMIEKAFIIIEMLSFLQKKFHNWRKSLIICHFQFKFISYHSGHF